MTRKRKICVMTGSRAEYGLLYWTLRELEARPDVELQLLVTAMHLAPEFGNTVEIIESDGFSPTARVPILLAGDDPVAMGKSLGLAVLGFLDTLSQLKPDLLVVLGDRVEVLGAASAATFLRVPVAHIHGGETTEGAMDEVFRHAVTKMSHLHFVAAADYARRVIQLGESPQRVFNVGALGLENFVRLSLPDRGALAKVLGFDLSPRTFVVTYHPATLAKRGAMEGLAELLAALERYKDARIVFTKANADAGGRAINQCLQDYVARHPGRAVLVASLGQPNYLGLLKLADLVIGNSSSGIIEAPAAGTPSVNVGARQAGRLRAQSVIDCAENSAAIAEAIATGLSARMRNLLNTQDPPYGRPRPVAREVVEGLCGVCLDNLVGKKFHDLEL